MTGDGDEEGIVPGRLPHRARRAWLAELRGELAIGERLPRRQRTDGLVDAALERRKAREIKPQLAELLRGRSIKQGTRVFVTTASSVKSDAARLGYLQEIERAGAVVLQGVCFYILQNIAQIRVQNGWSNLVTNSAKLANIIGAHKFNTILRRTRDCVKIALTGEES